MLAFFVSTQTFCKSLFGVYRFVRPWNYKEKKWVRVLEMLSQSFNTRVVAKNNYQEDTPKKEKENCVTHCFNPVRWSLEGAEFYQIKKSDFTLQVGLEHITCLWMRCFHKPVRLHKQEKIWGPAWGIHDTLHLSKFYFMTKCRHLGIKSRKKIYHNSRMFIVNSKYLLMKKKPSNKVERDLSEKRLNWPAGSSWGLALYGKVSKNAVSWEG